MSVQFKVPLIILTFFIFNVVFIGIYYNLSLSESISSNYNKNQYALELEADEIAKEVENEADYKARLEKIAAEQYYLFEVKTLSGEIMFETGDAEGVNFDQSVVTAFRYHNDVLLLKVIKPISLGFMSSFSYITDLFIAEFIIISITLLLLTLILYFNSFRPIVALQRNMQQYKLGIKPKRTKRKDEIGLLQNGFVELTDSLDEEKQMQYRIIASISHDIKTPLTSVMGYAERLQNENISKERHLSYIHTIYAKSQRIKELIEEFDEYISFDMQPSLKKQSITAGQICRMIEEDYYEDLLSVNVKLSVHCECPQNKLEIDILKINRVFGNIISNSVKYANEKDVEITVHCSRKDNGTLFTLSDNGMGVDPEYVDKIFEPFYTSDQSRRGAGLGLSICKSIVENHGGQICAENNENGGLTVHFILH